MPDIAIESAGKDPLIQQWKTVVDAQMHFNEMSTTVSPIRGYWKS